MHTYAAWAFMLNFLPYSQISKFCHKSQNFTYESWNNIALIYYNAADQENSSKGWGVLEYLSVQFQCL